jgi:hypothetical protein
LSGEEEEEEEDWWLLPGGDFVAPGKNLTKLLTSSSKEPAFALRTI